MKKLTFLQSLTVLAVIVSLYVNKIKKNYYFIYIILRNIVE